MSVSEKKYKNICCQKDEAIHVGCYKYYDFVFLWYRSSVIKELLGELGTILLFQICFYTLFILLIFICIFTTYKITFSLLQVRKEEMKSHVAENMKRNDVLCLLCQEQLFIYGAAFVFGLVNGMLFLKLFTIICMKIAGIQGIDSAPITIYAIVVVSIIMIVILLLSMVQCFRFVQSLQDKNSFHFKEKA